MKFKTSGKIILIVLFAGGLFCAKVFWWDKNHPITPTVYNEAPILPIDTASTPLVVNKPDTVILNEPKEEISIVPKKVIKKTQTKQKIKVQKSTHEGNEKSNNVIPNF
jgi:hypothetical protein